MAEEPDACGIAGDAALVLNHRSRALPNRVAQLVGAVVSVNSSAELVGGIQISRCRRAHVAVSHLRSRRVPPQNRPWLTSNRSEERRAGKECRSRWSPN